METNSYINEVYILNNYPQGEYMLKDIKFNTECQNEDDIFIQHEFCGCLRFEDGHFDFEIWGISDSIKDISQIIKVTYGENNKLKSVEVLKDNKFYPYIYMDLSDDELEEKIKECIKVCSDTVIDGIEKKFENDTISRIFICGYMDPGHEGINFCVGNKTAFDNASLKESVPWAENVDYIQYYYNEEYEIYIGNNEILHSLTYYLDKINYELCRNFYKRFFDEVEENILNKTNKSVKFADDFKFIFEYVD